MTIKELGYPSRTLLSAWVREQHPEAYPSVVSRSQKMSAAMKRSAVMALCMREGSAQSVAQDLGVSRPSLYVWKNQLLGHDGSTSMKRPRDSSPSQQRDELEQQLEELAFFAIGLLDPHPEAQTQALLRAKVLVASLLVNETQLQQLVLLDR